MESSDWVCSCGRKNLRVVSTCLACGEPRPGAPPPAALPAIELPRPPEPPAEPAPPPLPAPAAMPEPPPATPQRATGPRVACARCGYQNKPGVAVCSMCQQPLAAKATSRLGPAPASPPPRLATGPGQGPGTPSGRGRPAPATPSPFVPTLSRKPAGPDLSSARWVLRGCGCLMLVMGLCGILPLFLPDAHPPVKLGVAAEVTNPSSLLGETLPKRVSLKPRADWNAKVWRSPQGFAVNDPRIAAEVGLSDLTRDPSSLLGSVVTLSPGLIESYLWTYATKRGVKHETPTHVFGAILGTNGRVWVVSPRVSSEKDAIAQDFIKQLKHTGRVVRSSSILPPSVVEKWAQTRHAAVPATGIAILTYDTTLATECELWAPVEGTNEAVWLGVPGDLPPLDSLSLTAIYVPVPSRWFTRVNGPRSLDGMKGVLLTGALADEAAKEIEHPVSHVSRGVAGFQSILCLVVGLALVGLTLAPAFKRPS